MGTFMGHVLPGSIFLVFAIWWTVQISIRYYRSKLHKGEPYRSSVTFPCSCLCGKLATWQCEGLMKVFWTGLGLTLEIITGMRDGHFVYIGNGQHATMFFIFGFSGLIDILMHHGVQLPMKTDYCVSIVAYAVEGILFRFHLHGRSPLDVQVHSLLLYIIAMTVVVITAEMCSPKNVLVAYSRAYFVLLQGTWFWQIAFILYNPIPGVMGWNGHDHDQMMIATIIFGWHMILNLLFIIITGLVVKCVVQRASGVEVGVTQLVKLDSQGHTFISLDDDSDPELETVAQVGSDDGVVLGNQVQA